MGEPGTEPIEDDELLYRRVPIQPQFYDPTNDTNPSPQAFKPREDDTTGVSVFRAKYISPEDVARNTRGKRYYVAVLRTGDLRARGIDVEPKPILPDDPGHAEIPSLAYETRKNPRPKEIMVELANELCLDVLGPFPR